MTRRVIPDAAQHEVMRHRSGIVRGRGKLVTIPVLQRITPLRYVLRCARETF
jgi:hypothetical protein